jgi:hypothetical protein
MPAGKGWRSHPTWIEIDLAAVQALPHHPGTRTPLMAIVKAMRMDTAPSK